MIRAVLLGQILGIAGVCALGLLGPVFGWTDISLSRWVMHAGIGGAVGWVCSAWFAWSVIRAKSAGQILFAEALKWVLVLSAFVVVFTRMTEVAALPLMLGFAVTQLMYLVVPLLSGVSESFSKR